MDTIFGRRKSRPRQSSISAQELRSLPYDKILPGPPPVGRPAANISAPITNPTLTANGTDLNVHAIQRTKADRERAYASTTSASTFRSSSPHASLVTDDSSTLYSELADTTSNPSTASAARKLRQSGSSSGRRSPSSHSSSQALPPIPLSPPSSSTSVPLRPTSSSTTRSDNRSSRYTVQSDPHSSHSHHHFPNLHRHGAIDDFNFPRPSDDAEIEALFDNIVRTRDLDNLPPLTIDQKWNIVESDERIRWKEEKTREEQAKKVPEQSRPSMIEEKSPEWYLRKFLDRSITPKDASGLLVSLRGHEVGCVLHHFSFSFGVLPNRLTRLRRWFQQFILIQGTPVLAQTLSYISRKGKHRFVPLISSYLSACSTVLKVGVRPSTRIRGHSLYKADSQLPGMFGEISPNVA
jgi:cytokinesis protein